MNVDASEDSRNEGKSEDGKRKRSDGKAEVLDEPVHRDP